MAVAKTLAYYSVAIITTIKSFIIHVTDHNAMVINDVTRGITYNMPQVLGFFINLPFSQPVKRNLLFDTNALSFNFVSSKFHLFLVRRVPGRGPEQR